MAEFVYDCPHCGTRKAGFTGIGSDHGHAQGLKTTWNFMFVCRVCWKGILVRFSRVAELPAGVPRGITFDFGGPMDVRGDPRAEGYSLEEVYPSPIAPSAPDHIPEHLADNYVEALNVLQGGHWTGAGIMFRRVLEIATKDLAPGTERDNLRKRISDLVANGTMDPGMGELADCIRDEGNFAAHDVDDFDQESAEQLHEFTSLFLTYTYTLPQRIRDATVKRRKP